VLSGLPEVDRVTLVETDHGKREALASSFPGIGTAANLDAVQGEVDGMVVATHPTSHFELGLEALKRGWGVLIEKPLAASVEHAAELVSLAAQTGQVLMVGHTFVFNPVVQALRQRIEDGELGEVRLVRSNRLNLGLYQTDVNVIWDLAPHDVSIINFILGARPERVTAWASCFAHGQHEDVAMLRVEYPSVGAEAHVNVSWLDPSKVREVTVVGSERMAVYDDTRADERLRIHDRGVVDPEVAGQSYNPPMSYRYGNITSPHIPFSEPLVLEDTAFVEALRRGEATEATGRDGLEVVATMAAAEKSLRQGRPVEIDEILAVDLDLSTLTRTHGVALSSTNLADLAPQSSTGPIRFLDLDPLHSRIRRQVEEEWRDIVDAGAFVGGAWVERFENEWAEYCGASHVVGVANGTDAIELVLRAMPVGPGDEVIVPANTFIATAEAVIAAGATPVFVDVDPDTLLITAEHIEAAVTPKTVAAIAVHLYGQPCDLEGISRTTDRLGIALLEDAAQAHGASWSGIPVGTGGLAGTFSFYPGKNLGAFGDGGAVVTNDADLAATVRSLANHGRISASHTEHGLVGRNSRLDGIQAAALSAKLPHLAEENAGRRRVMADYLQRWNDDAVRPVAEAPQATSVWHLAVVQVDRRTEVMAAMTEAGIDTRIHYPQPCHTHPAMGAHPACPVVERASGRIMSLPMYGHLSVEQVDRVVETLTASLQALRLPS